MTMAGSTGATGAEDMAVIANAIGKAKSADPVKIAAAARTLNIPALKDAEYPYLATPNGVKFDENQDNVDLVIPFIQGTKNAGAVTVWPEDIADGKLAPLQ